MNSIFIESIDLKEHPIGKSNKRLRAVYYTALSYLIYKTISEPETLVGDAVFAPDSDNMTISGAEQIKKLTTERLEIYRFQFFSGEDDASAVLDKQSESEKIKAVSYCLKMPWRRNCRLLLSCDLALILFEDALVRRAFEIVKSYLSSRQSLEIDNIAVSLLDGRNIGNNKAYIIPLIKQYRTNVDFMQRREKRIIVTALTSAGKSTLINALVGKPVARTSQGVCTGNVCYIYNKAFEDGRVHLADRDVTLAASKEDIHSYKWTDPIYMASYFAGIVPQERRLCIIDTPGVDTSQLDKNRRDVTYGALLKENYDVLLYVVCPTKLGTDDEFRHMRWVQKNVPNEKVVFILNKIDDYDEESDDSIEENIGDLRYDLQNIGFENPVICPVSAYFSYLLKSKMIGADLSEYEEDEYTIMAKKFVRPFFDLSLYYEDFQCSPSDSEQIMLSKKAGLYGLEKMIYGGIL